MRNRMTVFEPNEAYPSFDFAPYEASVINEI